MPRSLSPIWCWSLTVVAAFASCAPPPASTPTKPGACNVSATADVDVAQKGPFNIGYRKSSLTYTAPGGVGPRTIVMHLWYPTNDTSGESAVYDPSSIFVDPEAWTGASLAPALSSCGYPTIEYSHGDQGVGGGASYLMKHFASHGWVALSVDHKDNTLWDNALPRPTALYFERSTDMAAILDAAANLQAPDPLAGRIATDKTVLIGHSFGTFTVWSTGGGTFDVDAIRSRCLTEGTCTEAELAVFSKGLRDPRVVAAIPMAGSPSDSFFGQTGAAAAQIPMLEMTGSANPVGFAELWPRLNDNVRWIDIAGGCHESFNLVGFIGGCNTLDTDVGYTIIRTYALAFARYHVLGDRSARVTGIVDGTTTVSDLVTFQKKERP